ncbi:MAG TPA: hypothetical protein VGE37_02050 [Archangium sp.]|jgi:hypothetical protein
MRRLFFVLWLVVAAVGLFGLGSMVHPPVGQPGTPAFLLVGAAWLVLVVPLSFAAWFRAKRRDEELVVETALTLWQQGDPGAGALVAMALELALEDEDERSLRRLLEVLLASTKERMDPSLERFVKAANDWLHDDGGHASREEHLERAREAAAAVMTRLASA